ncbi:hypothetical protein ACFSC6_06660 [Rufibacter sediminis]|uniref:Uncharacterized protein n=1 Tax=Rufibacter sediminis TaxID=2762756 RepID=A0ABR6VVZ4_9BACT|nr:hypothetical protein [Rufibacter sediminis]MBC3541089.1 hypothetical protein [Rufibacter sediminis]
MSTSKLKNIHEKLPLPDQKPIPPGRARVVLEVVKVLPELEPTGNGPCSEAPCKTEVKITRVMGYGSGFNQALSEGQQVQAYFPMSVKAGGGRPGVTAGKKITADLQNSLNEHDALVIHSYTLFD